MRYSGKIGISETVETAPGVYGPFNIVERPFRGRVLTLRRYVNDSGKINNDILITVKIEGLFDVHLRKNLDNIRYATYMGSKWEVAEVLPSYPKVVLTLGGLYHEER